MKRHYSRALTHSLIHDNMHGRSQSLRLMDTSCRCSAVCWMQTQKHRYQIHQIHMPQTELKQQKTKLNIQKKKLAISLHCFTFHCEAGYNLYEMKPLVCDAICGADVEERSNMNQKHFQRLSVWMFCLCSCAYHHCLWFTLLLYCFFTASMIIKGFSSMIMSPLNYRRAFNGCNEPESCFCFGHKYFVASLWGVLGSGFIWLLSKFKCLCMPICMSGVTDF